MFNVNDSSELMDLKDLFAKKFITNNKVMIYHLIICKVKKQFEFRKINKI